MKTIAVYGSLKMGRYNHPLIKDCKFLGESDVTGVMYLISTYPALIDDETAPEAVKHTVEVYEVDPATYARVHNMEIGAGYKVETKKLLLGSEVVDCAIFYANEMLAEYCKKNRKIINSY